MNLIIVLALSIICFCCSENKQEKDDETIRLVDREFLDKKLELSQIINVQKVINLETNDQSIIGKVDKIIRLKNHFYILDQRSANSVFIFDVNGKFINKIQGEGKGPEEILSPHDITINENLEELLVLDRRQKKVCFYTELGGFKRYIHLGFAPTHIEILPDDKMVFVSQGEYSIYITDKNGMVISKYLKADPRFQMTLNKPLLTNDGHVYFTRFLDNNIYEIEHNKVLKWKTIDYGEKGLTQDNYKELGTTGMDILIPESYKYGIYAPIITSQYFSFYFNYKKRGYFLVNNEQTGKLLISPGVSDDLFGGGVLLLSGSWQVDDKLVTVIEPSRINPEKSKYIDTLGFTLDIKSNPSLLLFDFIL